MESKYSAEGYTVWYGSQNIVHSEHNEVIIKGLTNSTESRVTSKQYHTLTPGQTSLLQVFTTPPP